MNIMPILSDEQYLSDFFDLQRIERGTHLIVAQCGRGKTYYINNFLMKRYRSALFLAPTRLILNQQQHEYDSWFSMERKRHYPFWTNAPQCEFQTFHWAANNLPALNSFDIIIIDEVQWLGIYSFDLEFSKKIEKLLFKLSALAQQKPILLFSATPGVPAAFDLLFGIETTYKIQKINVCMPQQITLYPNHGKATLLDHLKLYISKHLENFARSEQMLIYCENAVHDDNFLNSYGMDAVYSTAPIGRLGTPTAQIAAKLSEAFPQLKIGFINSATQGEFHSLTTGEIGDYDILITTSLLVYGVNLISEKLTMLAAATNKIDDIVQLSARARKAKFNLSIFWDLIYSKYPVGTLPQKNQVCFGNTLPGQKLQVLFRWRQLQQIATFGEQAIRYHFPFADIKYAEPTGGKALRYSLGEIKNAPIDSIELQNFYGTKRQLVDAAYRANKFAHELELVGVSHTTERSHTYKYVVRDSAKHKELVAATQ